MQHNSKSQIVTKLCNSNGDKTQKFQIVTKLKKIGTQKNGIVKKNLMVTKLNLQKKTLKQVF